MRKRVADSEVIRKSFRQLESRMVRNAEKSPQVISTLQKTRFHPLKFTFMPVDLVCLRLEPLMRTRHVE